MPRTRMWGRKGKRRERRSERQSQPDDALTNTEVREEIARDRIGRIGTQTTDSTTLTANTYTLVPVVSVGTITLHSLTDREFTMPADQPVMVYTGRKRLAEVRVQGTLLRTDGTSPSTFEIFALSIAKRNGSVPLAADVEVVPFVQNVSAYRTAILYRYEMFSLIELSDDDYVAPMINRVLGGATTMAFNMDFMIRTIKVLA